MDYFTLQPGFYFELYNLMVMNVLGPFMSFEMCEVYRNRQILLDAIENAGLDTNLITQECWEWVLTEDI